MTGRGTATGTGSCLLAVLLCCLLLGGDSFALGEPEPIPSELLYNTDHLMNNAENLMLLSKLRQMTEKRKDIAEREMMIQSLLEARAARARAQFTEYSGEDLGPPPNAVIHQTPQSGKRTAVSYLTLCHFKICNMGRKRQLNK